MKETILVTALAITEIVAIAVILIISVATYNEVKRDPYDVNNDGVADITDLSVLAAEVNERGK